MQFPKYFWNGHFGLPKETRLLIKRTKNVLTACTCRYNSPPTYSFIPLFSISYTLWGTQDILWRFLRALCRETPSPQQQEAGSCCGPIFPFTTSLCLKKSFNFQSNTSHMLNLHSYFHIKAHLCTKYLLVFRHWTQELGLCWDHPGHVTKWRKWSWNGCNDPSLCSCTQRNSFTATRTSRIDKLVTSTGHLSCLQHCCLIVHILVQQFLLMSADNLFLRSFTPITVWREWHCLSQ